MTQTTPFANHQHPRRAALVDELHARPFQPMTAPGRVLRLAFKEPRDAAERDRSRDHAHLIALLERHGVPRPKDGARQHAADLGPVRMKWESHTEFVSYLFHADGAGERLFDGSIAALLDPAWIAAAPGRIISASEVEMIFRPAGDPATALGTELVEQFDPESVTASSILEGNAVALGDFRIDPAGVTRFAVIVTGETGPRRLGRVVQRLLELEVYATMALLALPVARRTAARLNQVERELAELIARATDTGLDRPPDEALLDQLSALSAEIEAMAAAGAFRLDAADAYTSIVRDRVELLREQPLRGRQQFHEFITRRFDPAIRTVQATRGRLGALSDRAARLAQLLRTRVTVTLEAQNQEVLDQMNRRAALQLRLQETVEGLSVVAISYYAVSLAAYLLAPAAKAIGLDKTTLLALVAVPVVLAVWWFVRRIRARLAHKTEDP